jgi:hypothetical protein
MRKSIHFWKQYSNVLYPNSNTRAPKPSQPVRRPVSVAPPANPSQIFTIVPPPTRAFGSLGQRS